MSERETKPEINVRASCADDAEALYEIWTDPRVCWGTLQVPYQSPDAVRKKIASPTPGFYSLVAELDGRVVGCAGIHAHTRPRKRHVGDCGISVHGDCWGQGVGSALMAALLDLADNWLNLTRVELEVYVDNAPAIHLYEKFGFEIEGTKRLYAFRQGEFVDSHVMARLKE